jgi:hypothetical protein
MWSENGSVPPPIFTFDKDDFKSRINAWLEGFQCTRSGEEAKCIEPRMKY